MPSTSFHYDSYYSQADIQTENLFFVLSVGGKVKKGTHLKFLRNVWTNLHSCELDLQGSSQIKGDSFILKILPSKLHLDAIYVMETIHNIAGE